MAELDEVVGDERPGPRVVGADDRDATAGHVVHADRRDPAAQQVGDPPVVLEIRRRGEDAVDPAFEQLLGVGARVVPAGKYGADEHDVALVPRLPLGADDELREHPVVEIVRDDADREGRLGDQAPGERVGHVTEVGRRSADPGLGLCGHRDGAAVEHLAHSLKTHPSSSGHIFQRHIHTGSVCARGEASPVGRRD